VLDATSLPNLSSIASLTLAFVANATALIAPYANMGAVKPLYKPLAPSCANKFLATHIAVSLC
jgi:hypothetical protein